MIDTISTWHQIVKERNESALDQLLSDDVVFYSPVVHTPQPGKKITTLYLSAAFHVFINDTFHYVRELTTANDAVLEFEVEIDGIMVNGIDMIRWNEEGKIEEFKVFVRPLKAINLIHQKMAELLERGR
jgi:SnoaL-like protein